jgi:hypothetical protein
MRDVPTLAEVRVNVEPSGWFGLVAPARTPEPIVARLNAAFIRALREPEMVERLRSLGAEPRSTTAAAFATCRREELAKRAEALRVSGARVLRRTRCDTCPPAARCSLRPRALRLPARCARSRSGPTARSR